MGNLSSGNYWLEGVTDSSTIYFAYEDGNIGYATEQGNIPDNDPYTFSITMINDTTACLMVVDDKNPNKWMYWDTSAKEGIVTFDTHDGTPSNRSDNEFQFVLTDNGDGTYDISPSADSTLFLTVQQNANNKDPYSVKCMRKPNGKTQKWKFVRPVVPTD